MDLNFPVSRPLLESSAMTTTLPPEAASDADRAKRMRGRTWLVTAALMLTLIAFAWIFYSRDVVAQHEARVVSGDFASLRIEAGDMVVDGYGRVTVGGFLSNPPLTVASMRLIPRGHYTSMIVGNDGDTATHKTTDLVIGAKDDKGAWHPATALEILARMKTPQQPGGPL